MQTRDQQMNDLIEALTISSTHRQRLEQRVKEQLMQSCAAHQETSAAKVGNWR
jgi:hypothetical protein